MNLKRLIKKIVASRAVHNGIWLYLLQFFNTIVPMLTIPYITRILGSGGYGIFSFLLNIIGYINTIIEYGFNFSATRKFVLMSKKKTKQDLFSSVLLARISLSVICFIGLNVCLLFGPFDYTQSCCMNILFLSSIGTALQQTWLFQGLEKMHYISIISMCSRSLSVILIFLLIKSSKDLVLYCFLYSLTPLCIGVSGLIISFHLLHINHLTFNWSAIKRELKEGWNIFTTSFSSKLFSGIGLTLLGMYSTSNLVGIYAAIHKIPEILLLMWSPISQILYPISSKKMKNNFESNYRSTQKMSFLISSLFILISLMVMLFSNNIVAFAFGNEYVDYYYICIPMLIWVNLGIFNNFAGIQTLLAAGYDSVYRKCFQISVSFSIIISFFLIYNTGIIGASLAPMLSELLLFVLLKLSIRKILKQSSPAKL